MSTKPSRRLNTSATAKLTREEYEQLCHKAECTGLTASEYLRKLILTDLATITEDQLLRTVEAEHTRLMLLTAQQGKELNAKAVRDLRSQAITTARGLVEQTLRLVRQV
jgi:hypothetical protein